MRIRLATLAVGTAAVFALGCGEAEQGPPGADGEDTDILVDRFNEHDDCPTGGFEIHVDGELEAVICDGVAGDDGEDGQDGDDGADGQDGEAGDDGEIPDVSAERQDDLDECDGGSGLVISFEFEDAEDSNDAVVCDGEQGDQGDTRFAVQDLEDAGVDHDCGTIGGYFINVEGDESSGIVVCRDLELDGCETVAPESPAMRHVDDPTTTFAADIEVGGITDLDGGVFPESVDERVEIGLYDREGEDEDNLQEWSDWHDAERDQDYDSEADEWRYTTELGYDDAGWVPSQGEYYYLSRVSLDGGESWTYCEYDGDIVDELGEFDAQQDAGELEVRASISTTISATAFLGWDFSNLDLSDPEEGEGEASFRDGDNEESDVDEVVWDADASEYFWTTPVVDGDGDNVWPEDDTATHYFEFASDNFADYEPDSLWNWLILERSENGPTQLQIGLVYEDETDTAQELLLAEFIDLEEDGPTSEYRSVAPADFEGGGDFDAATDVITAYRFYGLNAEEEADEQDYLRVRLSEWDGDELDDEE